MKKINKNLILKIKKETGKSIFECYNILKKYNWNLKKVKNLLNNKIFNKKFNNFILKYKVINFYIYKNLSIIIELKFNNEFTINTHCVVNMIKKIIYIIIKKNPINIFKLFKLKINNIKLNKILKNINYKLKENFIINKFVIIKLKDKINWYLYKNKNCLIINYISKNNEIIKDICLHIISLKTKYLSIKNISYTFINILYNKTNINIIYNGNINYKYIIEKNILILLKNITLLNQKFIKNHNLIIKKILNYNKIIIKKYILY